MMTWEELLDKYSPNEEEVFTLDIDKDTKIQFDCLGGVHIMNKGRFGIAYIDIATDRTPEQMDAIITALTEKK